MVEEKTVSQPDSIADILSPAFDAAAMPPETAELILNAKLPQTDVQRAGDLLTEKRDRGLTPEQETLLQDYLHADSIFTLLKSRALRTLGQSAA
jgi:hypothetical protein